MKRTQIRSERMQTLINRYHELALSGARKANSTGELRCVIERGPFPKMSEVPSRAQGYRPEAEQWAEDYAFLLDTMEPQIHGEETIVGEIHWEMADIRPNDPAVTRIREEFLPKARELGELGGYCASSAHTCPDMEIVLTEGYDGILKRIREYKEMYGRLNNLRRHRYLCAMETVCLACIRYIERYAAHAEALAKAAEEDAERLQLTRIGTACRRIAHHAPETFYEAVQVLHFSILFDKAIAHGNGYGRIDQYLLPFYQQGKKDGSLSREDARDLVAELYLKLAGCFFGVGGRKEDGTDAVNELSWVALEAYDLTEIDCNLAVMWHSDIDAAFYAYACDILARYGQATPVLINWDIMYASELRSGIPKEDAWKVCYAGCQWYSIPGKEYCGHDMTSVPGITLLLRALKRGVTEKAADFETLYRFFEEEIHYAIRLIQAVESLTDQVRGDLWPEIVTSMFAHGPIERGQDLAAPRGVDYQYTSFNIAGIPNVADSFTAVKKLVYEKQLYTLEDVVQACEADWAGQEIMRQRFLNQPKYGNDLPEADEMYVKVCNSFQEIAESYVNRRGGQPFRPCLYSYMSHLSSAGVGASPDGRRCGEPYSHGINPQAGASKRGMLPMVHSAAAADMRKFQGGSIQIELQPKFFDGKEEHFAYIRDFSNAFFKSGGFHLNINIMDLAKLEDAMEHPENPEYQQLMVRVTGFSARFVSLSPDFQKDFVSRTNYASLER